MSTRHYSQNSIEPYSDQYITRPDKPDEPLYRGAGSSVHSTSVDVSSGTILSTYDTTAATSIGYNGSEFDYFKWKHLERYHNGNIPNWNGHKQENHEPVGEKLHRVDKLRIAEALCSDLDLNVGETKEVLYQIPRIDLTQFGHHRGIERVILGLIAVVVEDRRIRYGADLYTASIHRHEAFKLLMTKFGIDTKDLYLIKRIVRQQISTSDDIDGALHECIAV